MNTRRTEGRRRPTGRRWHIPPPLVHGPDTLEGAAVLEEGPGALAAILWQVVRDVMLWAHSPEKGRAELFAPGAAARREAQLAAVETPEELRAPLAGLAGLVRDPAGASAEAVALACRSVAQWAEAAGRPATALAYAQGAALATPGEPAAAFQVGRIARLIGDHARAEVWLRRTVGLARQARDWRLYSQAFRSLGNLSALRGNYPAARRLQIRALRGARRGGMRSEAGQALHDLFGIAIETGDHAEAESYARLALEAYRPRHRNLPRLAHDLAYHWMERGDFARALPVFLALVPVLKWPLERLFVAADLARASAGTGDRAGFGQWWERTERELENPEVGEGAARALLELARGALALGDWHRAEQAAGRALETATRREEAKVRFAAEAVLDAARRRQPAEAPPCAAPADARRQELAEGLVQSLNALAAAAR